MRVLAVLVAKDLLRKARAPVGLLIVLSFPVLFAAMLGLTFGSGGRRAPRVHLLVENQDGGLAGRTLVSSLTSRKTAEYADVEVVGAEGAARLEKGEASALLRIPAGFSQALLDGRPVALTLVRNPAQGILPEIAEQLLLMRTDAAEFRAPPVGELDAAALPPGAPDQGPGSGFSLIFLVILPGVSVYALFLVGDQAMRDIVTEATAGTLRRQLTGPLGVGTLVVAKAAYTMVLCLIALLVLTAVGAAVLRRGIDPAGFLALSLSLILAITGTAATVYGLAPTERAGATVASIVYLALGIAGGSFVALESLPPAARVVAPLSPFYWGTAGYRRLIESGGTLRDVVPHAAVLAGLGAVLLTVGALALQRSVRRGRLA